MFMNVLLSRLVFKRKMLCLVDIVVMVMFNVFII